MEPFKEHDSLHVRRNSLAISQSLQVNQLFLWELEQIWSKQGSLKKLATYYYKVYPFVMIILAVLIYNSKLYWKKIAKYLIKKNTSNQQLLWND